VDSAEDHDAGIYHVSFGEFGCAYFDDGNTSHEARNSSMRRMIVISTFVLLLQPTIATANSARIIVAAATSSATKAALVNVFSSRIAEDSWSPGFGDSGANEGVYVQFESTV